MQSNLAWKAELKNISLLCQINGGDDRPQFTEEILAMPQVESKEDDGSVWRRFLIRAEGLEIEGAVFVRKIVLTVATHEADVALRDLLPRLLEMRTKLSRVAASIGQEIDEEVEIRSYLIANCGKINEEKSKATPGVTYPRWINDGLSTFSLRAFDSRRNRAGIIRISRHLTITYGITDELTVDIVGLVYEKFLYATDNVTSVEVFSLLDALGDYVLPTEVSLYTHRIATKLASFAVVLGTMLGLANVLQETVIKDIGLVEASPLLALLYAAVLVVAIAVWRAIDRWSYIFTK